MCPADLWRGKLHSSRVNDRLTILKDVNKRSGGGETGVVNKLRLSLNFTEC